MKIKIILSQLACMGTSTWASWTQLLSGNKRAYKLRRLNLLWYKVKQKVTQRQERQKAKFLSDEDFETGD